MTSLICTFFGVGHLRPAPGTWGSLVAVVLAVAAYEAGLALLVPLGALLAALLGFWAVPRYLKGRGDTDPSEVVIDEVAGQWLALSFTFVPLWQHNVHSLIFDAWPAWKMIDVNPNVTIIILRIDLPLGFGAWPGWLVPFLLFRLFDIWKPWLVGRADRRHDANGVMLDDLWAGLFAGIGSVILAAVYHIWLKPMLG